jgi:hypothetical protein
MDGARSSRVGLSFSFILCLSLSYSISVVCRQRQGGGGGEFAFWARLATALDARRRSEARWEPCMHAMQHRCNSMHDGGFAERAQRSTTQANERTREANRRRAVQRGSSTGTWGTLIDSRRGGYAPDTKEFLFAEKWP